MNKPQLVFILSLFAILVSLSYISSSNSNNLVARADQISTKYDILSVSLIYVTEPFQDVHFGYPGHPLHLTYLLVFQNNTVWHLMLELNTQLLPPNFKFTYDVKIATSTYNQIYQENSNHVEHCFYHGSISEFANSRVAISTCDGLSGTISVNGEYYSLEKMTDEMYILYNTKNKIHISSGYCGVEGHSYDNIDSQTLFSNPSRVRRTIFNTWVELHLTLDNSHYKTTGSNLIYSRQYAVSIANQIDMNYRAIGVRVALVGLVVWSVSDGIEVNKTLSITLNKWIAYLPTLRSNSALQFDNAQLIIGLSNPGNNVIGYAPISSMCQQNSGGVNRDTRGDDAGYVASTISHEMGHNFGMEHDDGKQCNNCQDSNGCIMNAQLNSNPPTSFSACSTMELAAGLAEGLGSCLSEVPTQFANDPVCGNGFVEGTEVCDCGSISDCATLDPCCEPGQCVLKANVECSATGSCCDNCQFRNPTTICREAVNNCDIPDYCSGTNGFCPTNLYKRDGLPCNTSLGSSYCYNGLCRTLEDQCQLIWGTAATRSNNICYTNLNTIGNQYGNCGETNNQYTACTTANVFCGTVHCTGTLNYQLPGTYYYRTVTYSGISCTTVDIISSNVDVMNADLSFDGTICSDTTESICIANSCVLLSSLSIVTCPVHQGLECSNRGVCTNIATCFCNIGFSGSACQFTIIDSTTTTTTTTTPTTTDTTTTTTITTDTTSTTQIITTPTTPLTTTHSATSTSIITTPTQTPLTSISTTSLTTSTTTTSPTLTSTSTTPFTTSTTLITTTSPTLLNTTTFTLPDYLTTQVSGATTSSSTVTSQITSQVYNSTSPTPPGDIVSVPNSVGIYAGVGVGIFILLIILALVAFILLLFFCYFTKRRTISRKRYSFIQSVRRSHLETNQKASLYANTDTPSTSHDLTKPSQVYYSNITNTSQLSPIDTKVSININNANNGSNDYKNIDEEFAVNNDISQEVKQSFKLKNNVSQQLPSIDTPQHFDRPQVVSKPLFLPQLNNKSSLLSATPLHPLSSNAKQKLQPDNKRTPPPSDKPKLIPDTEQPPLPTDKPKLQPDIHHPTPPLDKPKLQPDAFRPPLPTDKPKLSLEAHRPPPLSDKPKLSLQTHRPPLPSDKPKLSLNSHRPPPPSDKPKLSLDTHRPPPPSDKPKLSLNSHRPPLPSDKPKLSLDTHRPPPPSDKPKLTLNYHRPPLPSDKPKL